MEHTISHTSQMSSIPPSFGRSPFHLLGRERRSGFKYSAEESRDLPEIPHNELGKLHCGAMRLISWYQPAIVGMVNLSNFRF